MGKFYRTASYLIFSLSGLLIFFWFFRDKLTIPNWLQTFGRMHLVVLHLPIGFFVMAVLVALFRKQFKGKAFKNLIRLIFTLTSLSLIITALAGFVLSTEGGYDDETLTSHLNSGVILSILIALIAGTSFKKQLTAFQYSLAGAGFIILIVTGHYGATLTHGDRYLSGSASGTGPEKSNPDSITFFSKAILPVIDNKCASCHNPKKKKGELILITPEGILNGGENGPVINPEDPEESELLKRIHLNMEHDDHMPPFGKPQLTSTEITLLEKWILSEADFKSLWPEYPENDSLIILANNVLLAYEKPERKAYNFDFVSGEEIESLNTPFRTVSQISSDVPALKASFYLPQFFSSDDLKTLKAVYSQLTYLNLSGMPVSDKDIPFIIQLENLENLNLNGTGITDDGIKQLKSLGRLQKLSLAGTKVTANGINEIAGLPNLNEVYVWNTSVSDADVIKLKSTNENISWNLGYQPDDQEILKLTPPILKNETFLLAEGEEIILKHNLPGTTIRISLNGVDPDSVNADVFSSPIKIRDHITLKTMATKEGWLKSNILEYNFYIKGIVPVKTELLSPANKSYKAEGAISLTDNQIGDPGNFRDGNWLGFRESDFVSQFTFGQDTVPSKVTLIYNKNTGSYLMPPEFVEIWGGVDAHSLKLLSKIIPEQPTRYEPVKSESISHTFTEPPLFVKIIGRPVKKLPQWHSGKGEKGWLMVSEVIFR